MTAGPPRERLLTPLSWRWKLALAAEVATTRTGMMRRLRRDGLQPALAHARSGASPTPRTGDAEVARRLARGIALTLWAFPGDGRCLARSLTLTRLMARRGITAEFMIGVRPGASFGAHAWVRLAGEELTTPGEGDFRELVSL